jgi:hypothetical protein
LTRPEEELGEIPARLREAGLEEHGIGLMRMDEVFTQSDL